MSKFNKFLDENEESKVSRSNKVTKNENTIDYTSLKIKFNTLDKLRNMKLVTNEQSYSSLIDKMIDNYITQLSEDDQEKLKMLFH